MAWLLASVVLFLTILPAHYHMHHEQGTDPAEHRHSIDFHSSAIGHDASHHEEHSQTLATTPDGIIKKLSNFFTPVILLAMLLALLPLLIYRVRLHTNLRLLTPEKRYLRFSPPLRAPPRA